MKALRRGSAPGPPHEDGWCGPGACSLARSDLFGVVSVDQAPSVRPRQFGGAAVRAVRVDANFPGWHRAGRAGDSEGGVRLSFRHVRLLLARGDDHHSRPIKYRTAVKAASENKEKG